MAVYQTFRVITKSSKRIQVNIAIEPIYLHGLHDIGT